MIEVKIYLANYAHAANVFAALAAVAPDVLVGAQTAGLGQAAQQVGNNLTATVTPEKQEAARASAVAGTAGAAMGTTANSPPPAPAPAPAETPVKRGPGRPPKDPAKSAPTTPVEALQQAVGEKIDYATSGMPERIAALAADPEMKTALIALIKQHGGVTPEGKTNAKFILADKLAEFRDELDKLDPPQTEEAAEGDIG